MHSFTYTGVTMRRFQVGLRTVLFGSTLLACGGGGGAKNPPDNTPDSGVVSDASEAPDRTVAADGAGPALDGTTPSEASTGGPADGSADVAADAGGSDGSVADAGGGHEASTAETQIVVDQFGYRTSAAKIAVVRSAQAGFDTSPFTPGTNYVLVDANSGTTVFPTGSAVLTPVAWNGGATDPSSGDQAWWVDFSAFTTPGTYFVRDVAKGAVSDTFEISDSVYANVLVQAARVFYYQRDGIAKLAQYAGTWSDTAQHPQDTHCTLYSTPDASSSVDLHGGWFNAGDQNKYTNWAASNAIELLRAYSEHPAAFAVCDAGCTGDSYGIPESNNGVPDILDEAKWGLDWLGRMQNVDGSVLSLVGNSNGGGGTTNGASPPSSDTGACIYGPASASATWSAAAAFAYGSLVFQSVNSTYASTLKAQAIAAWNWATANGSVVFFNGNILATYEQELTTTGRLEKQVQAAVFLFELTGSSTYQTVIDANYAELQSSFLPGRIEELDTLLEYAKTPGATGSVVASITSTFRSSVEAINAFGNLQASTDPYLAYIPSYAFNGTVGSNQAKTGQGNMFYDLDSFQVSAPADGGADAASTSASAATYAEGYVHYLHGLNPLGLAYLSNMGGQGATSSLTQIFSAWFSPETVLPPPGFISGGPNPGYTWDACCPAGCGSPQNNAICGSAPPAPPAGQPDQKSYKDFDTNWPLDSWQVSEPNNAYQAQYIRLVSKFVP